MEAHRPTLSENSAPQFISDSLQPTQIGSARIRLPNEIVDLIIQECWLDWDSRHKVLRECSLVSRKWRAMVIPYLFREITINPNGHTTSAYAQFLLDTPLIASRIRSVHIRRAPFTVPELIPLLERLPGLRSLRLYVKNFRVRTGSSSTRPLRDFTLETLECDFSECIKRRFKRFDEILTLFSDIKTLMIEDTHPIHLEAFELAGQAVPAVSASAVGKTQVHELYYQAGPRVTTYVSPLLSSMDAVRNLTSLCYFVHGANMRNDFIQLSGFLAAVGPTLQKLKLVWDWLVEEDLASNRKTILEAAQRGLSLCTNLVEFELHGDIVDDDGTDAILNEDYEKVLREEWHLQAGFIASIPSSNLRHLSFSLAIEDCYYPDVVHSPLLSKIRDACNRFTQLEALCLGFCNNESRQEIWQCIFYEMREFERILCCHHNALASIDFEVCNEQACKRYLLGN